MDTKFYDIFIAHTYTFVGTVAVPTEGVEPAAYRATMQAAPKADVKVRDLVALESSQEMYWRRGI